MTKDLNKGITKIEYNSLNLPRLMDIKSPLAEARKEYTYTASGAKLRVVSKWNPNFSTNPVIGSDVVPTTLTKTKTTDYVGNIIYEDNALKRILVDGGYIEGGVYNFYLTDHLGNNRAVAKADASIIQRTQFYPFGAAFADGLSAGLQPYKYNGKELDAEHGVNWYDYAARQKSDFGFTSVDPHAENYYSFSPYVYGGNNPILNIDPTGEDYWSTNDPDEIARFFSNMQRGMGVDSYDYGQWNHATDAEFTSNLTYNDETQTFHSNFVSRKSNSESSSGYEYVNNGISLKAYSDDSNDKAASIYHGLSDKAKIENLAYAGLTGGEHIIGPALILLGQPINALKPIGALGSKPGSSIASYSLSKAFPQRFTHKFGKKVGTSIAKKVGTNTIGRAAGRFVPYAGWAVTFYDATTTGFELGQEYGPSKWYGNNDYKWFK